MENLITNQALHSTEINQFCSEARLNFPAPYRSFLQNSNGAEAYDGYFRIFGIGPKAKIDAIRWNQENIWKFSWPKEVNEYWCFGGTAWGDQYAFKRGDALARVHCLDGLSMKPRLLKEDFAAFFDEYFLENATNPYDEMTQRAKQKFGRLDIADQLVYSPSPLLSGSKNIEQVMTMPTVAAMVLNGDMYSQLGLETQSRQVETIEPYTDTEGRMRLRVVWLDD